MEGFCEVSRVPTLQAFTAVGSALWAHLPLSASQPLLTCLLGSQLCFGVVADFLKLLRSMIVMILFVVFGWNRGALGGCLNVPRDQSLVDRCVQGIGVRCQEYHEEQVPMGISWSQRVSVATAIVTWQPNQTLPGWSLKGFLGILTTSHSQACT